MVWTCNRRAYHQQVKIEGAPRCHTAHKQVSKARKDYVLMARGSKIVVF